VGNPARRLEIAYDSAFGQRLSDFLAEAIIAL
jgi:hypothetical protein